MHFGRLLQMLQGGEVFNTAVQALLSSKRQALDSGSSAGGEHLCFMGCGTLQSDQYTHMVVASFLHSNTQFVSLLAGGYSGNTSHLQIALGKPPLLGRIYF
jgi:hypothetical protein